MSKKYTIETNLNKSLILGSIAVITVIVYYLCSKSLGSIITLFLVAGVFVQYLFSKKIYQIVIDGEVVIFTYLKLYYKTSMFKLDILDVKERVEVHFRGGKDEILEIYNKETNKIIFEVSKRAFKSETDYETFVEAFNIG